MKRTTRFALLFAAALFILPAAHTDAGDDYCPAGQFSCQRTCGTNYDRCVDGFWRANPTNELAYEQCELRCSETKWQCDENCESL